MDKPEPLPRFHPHLRPTRTPPLSPGRSLDQMRRRRGIIINISSAAASKPGRGQSNYVAAKAGLEGFTKAMAVELASKGVRVVSIACRSI